MLFRLDSAAGYLVFHSYPNLQRHWCVDVIKDAGLSLENVGQAQTFHLHSEGVSLSV